MDKLTSWDYLTTAPKEADVLGKYPVAYAVAFVLGFIIASFVYYRPRTPFLSKYIRRKALGRLAFAGMWVFGLGLFFFLIRILVINPFTFAEPVWMVAMMLIAAVLIVISAVVLFVALRRGPIPRASTGWTQSGYHAAPRRRPVQRRRALR
ncbi:MAG TPA: hypothetical protein VFQ54_08170 [Thermomicrobiales bacterium]|nr:hypothetical protein [Thermomicrobiales bacterium]